jgi:hypothetical protein
VTGALTLIVALQVEALVEQGGIDLGRGLIDEPVLTQQIEDALTFIRRQGARRFEPALV